MKKYYVNKQEQPNGDHEVHTPGCKYFPAAANAHYLGMYSTCHPAVVAAKMHYPRSNGCYFCSYACHTH